MYRVVIIEDDPMVSAINRQYVEVTTSFRVDRTFKSGGEALEYFKNHDTDLIILDYYTPLMNGSEFIDHLHAMGKYPAIIMVTSANDTDIVRSLLSRGVMDYLVKPFDYDRFKLALNRFHEKQSNLDKTKEHMSQEAIDQLFARTDAGKESTRQLSKGLNVSTLALVRTFLSEHPNEYYTSEQVAEEVNLSRITIRRYLNYLVDTHEIVSSIDYKTGGRPSVKYRFSK
ncbi:MAG: response regulator [Lachnospiraceae bacterium]|nr:response regulator [Lachnospiraceae bacterium]